MFTFGLKMQYAPECVRSLVAQRQQGCDCAFCLEQGVFRKLVLNTLLGCCYSDCTKLRHKKPFSRFVWCVTVATQWLQQTSSQEDNVRVSVCVGVVVRLPFWTTHLNIKEYRMPLALNNRKRNLRGPADISVLAGSSNKLVSSGTQTQSSHHSQWVHTANSKQ